MSRETEVRSTDLRRELIHLLQQLAVDAALTTVYPDLDKNIAALDFPDDGPKGVKRLVRMAVYDTSQELVRQAVYTNVMAAYKSGTKALKVKGCGTITEEGEMQPEDEMGFLEATEGFEGFKARSKAQEALRPEYLELGKDHLKNKLVMASEGETPLSTKGSKEQLIERLIAASVEYAWEAHLDAAEEAQIARENAAKKAARARLKELDPKLAKLDAPKLRKQLKKRKLDTTGKKVVLMERLSEALEGEKATIKAERKEAKQAKAAAAQAETKAESGPDPKPESVKPDVPKKKKKKKAKSADDKLELTERVKGGLKDYEQLQELQELMSSVAAESPIADEAWEFLSDDPAGGLSTEWTSQLRAHLQSRFARSVHVQPVDELQSAHSQAPAVDLDFSSMLSLDKRLHGGALPTVDDIMFQQEREMKRRVHSTAWILERFDEDLGQAALDEALETNLAHPDFECTWALGTETGPGSPSQYAMDLSTTRVRGGVAFDQRGESVLSKPTGPTVTSRCDAFVAAVTAKMTGYLDGQGLAWHTSIDAKQDDQPEPNRFAAKRRLRLASRVRGGDDEEHHSDEEHHEEDDDHVHEHEEVELTEEEKAIMAGEIENVDNDLLHEQEGNRHTVKKYLVLGEMLLEKAHKKIDVVGWTVDHAKEFLSEVVQDIVFCRASLALDSGITEKIDKIEYIPEGEDVPFILPTFMKVILQKAVDDIIEGNVREQVNKMVQKCFKMATKLFKKTVPGIEMPATDVDGADGEEAEAGDDDAEDERIAKLTDGHRVALEEGLDRYVEEDIRPTHQTAGAALVAGVGVASILGIPEKDSNGDKPLILEVLDEDTLEIALYNMTWLEPVMKRYSKIAHKAQGEWYSNEFPKKKRKLKEKEKDKARKYRGQERIQIPLHMFHYSGLESAIVIMLKKMKKSGKELRALGEQLRLKLPENGGTLMMEDANGKQVMTPLEYRSVVTEMMQHYVQQHTVNVCFPGLIDEQVDKAAKKLAKLNKEKKGTKKFLDKEGLRLKVEDLRKQAYDSVMALIKSQVELMVCDTWDNISKKLIIPGTEASKPVDETHWTCVPTVGGCKQCGCKLSQFNEEHVACKPVQTLEDGETPEADKSDKRRTLTQVLGEDSESRRLCDVCGTKIMKKNGVFDMLFVCDNFSVCDWGACGRCQARIEVTSDKPPAVGLQKLPGSKKKSKDKKKNKKNKKNKAKKNDDSTTESYVANPLMMDEEEEEIPDPLADLMGAPEVPGNAATPPPQTDGDESKLDLDPTANIDALFADGKLTKKLEKQAQAAASAMTAYAKVAKQKKKEWLKAEGQQLIDVATKDDKLGEVLVPVVSFQIEGLRAVVESFAANVDKSYHNKSRALLEISTALDEETYRSTDLRREVSHLLQQMAVDETVAKMHPELDKRLAKLDMSPKGAGRATRQTAYAVAEGIVRKAVHTRVIAAYKDEELRKALKVKGCGVAKEEGEAQKVDEHGFLVSLGGYPGFARRKETQEGLRPVYDEMGKSHLKSKLALACASAPTSGKKSEVIERLMMAMIEYAANAELAAEEQAQIKREAEARALALVHLTAQDAEFAKMRAPALRKELEKRGLDTSGKKAELMERLASAMELFKGDVEAGRIDVQKMAKKLPPSPRPVSPEKTLLQRLPGSKAKAKEKKEKKKAGKQTNGEGNPMFKNPLVRTHSLARAHPVSHISTTRTQLVLRTCVVTNLFSGTLRPSMRMIMRIRMRARRSRLGSNGLDHSKASLPVPRS